MTNLIECQKAGIRSRLKLLGASHKGKGRSAGIYPEEGFLYQPQTDSYLCPAGQLMRPRRLHPERLVWEYVTAKGACLACHLRAFCTRSRTADLRRRQHLIERSFADATNCHGFKRARWRGLWKQAIQDLLIATVQNLRTLLRHLPEALLELLFLYPRLLEVIIRFSLPLALAPAADLPLLTIS